MPQSFDQVLSDHHVPHIWQLNDGDHDEIYWAAHTPEYIQWYASNWGNKLKKVACAFKAEYNISMSLTLKEVEHIAELARLELSAEEKERYRQQLSAILDYARSLQSLDTGGIPPRPACCHRAAFCARTKPKRVSGESRVEKRPAIRGRSVPRSAGVWRERWLS